MKEKQAMLIKPQESVMEILYWTLGIVGIVGLYLASQLWILPKFGIET